MESLNIWERLAFSSYCVQRREGCTLDMLVRFYDTILFEPLYQSLKNKSPTASINDLQEVRFGQ